MLVCVGEGDAVHIVQNSVLARELVSGKNRLRCAHKRYRTLYGSPYSTTEERECDGALCMPSCKLIDAFRFLLLI